MLLKRLGNHSFESVGAFPRPPWSRRCPRSCRGGTSTRSPAWSRRRSPSPSGSSPCPPSSRRVRRAGSTCHATHPMATNYSESPLRLLAVSAIFDAIFEKCSVVKESPGTCLHISEGMVRETKNLLSPPLFSESLPEEIARRTSSPWRARRASCTCTPG